MNTKTITTVNNVEILALAENESRLVPIKPICEALGIDYPTQFSKIKNDEDFSSVIGLSPTTGADGKQYEMTCLPAEFIFGWLMTINPKNVKPEAKESVSKYRMECFRVLADHFMGPQEFLIKRDEVIDRETEEYERYKLEHAEAKQKMNTAKSNLDRAKSMTLQEWRLNKSQLQVFSDEEQKGETTEE